MVDPSCSARWLTRPSWSLLTTSAPPPFTSGIRRGDVRVGDGGRRHRPTEGLRPLRARDHPPREDRPPGRRPGARARGSSRPHGCTAAAVLALSALPPPERPTKPSSSLTSASFGPVNLRRKGDEHGRVLAVAAILVAELLDQIALFQLDADQNVAGDHHREQQMTKVIVCVAQTASKTPR